MSWVVGYDSCVSVLLQKIRAIKCNVLRCENEVARHILFTRARANEARHF